jgi:Flp pilus assembly protein TadG
MLKLLLDRYRRKSQKFTRSDSGVSAVEFVLIAPIVFLLLGVIIETGLMLFTEITLQDATDAAARTIRTGKAQMTGLTAANLKTAICAEVGHLVSCSKVVVYVNSDGTFANLLADVPPYINIGPTTGGTTVSAPPCYNPGSPSSPAIIVATYDWYFTSYGISFWGNVAGNKARRLTAVTLFQNQPFPGTGPGTC